MIGAMFFLGFSIGFVMQSMKNLSNLVYFLILLSMSACLIYSLSTAHGQLVVETFIFSWDFPATIVGTFAGSWLSDEIFKEMHKKREE